MASGQQKAAENIEKFNAWAATQSDGDFKQIIRRGQLSRTEVAKGAGIGKSALQQNPAIKELLNKLETDLRTRQVLPELAKPVQTDNPKINEYDNTAAKRLQDALKLSKLEREVIELKAKNKELEKRLSRFCELSEALSEMGMMPR